MLFVLAFVATFALTPLIARRLEHAGIVGVDLHKEEKVKIPEMAGLSILLSFLLCSLAGYLLYRQIEFLVVGCVVFLVGAVGILDYFYTLSPVQKVISLSLIGALLVPYTTPVVMGYDLGILYFLALPVFFMAACNFTNMLAGFNGLEAGVGAISSISIAAVAYITGQNTSFAIASVTAASLLAFLYYNRYPARVFPGDVGTLIIGAALFSAIVFGKFEPVGVIIFLPYILDAGLKYFSAGVMSRESQAPTRISKGRLYAPLGGNLSLPRLFLARKPLTEKGVVYRVWAIALLSGILAVLVVIR